MTDSNHIIRADNWDSIMIGVKQVLDELAGDGCPDPFFRGHKESQWELIPLMGRNDKEHLEAEDRLYSRFWTWGEHLFPANFSDWDVLFQMRHCSIPTRLLDWTEDFAVAAYLAVTAAAGDSAVWILNPYKLNGHTFEREVIPNLNKEFEKGYEHYFTEGPEKLSEFRPPVLAVLGSTRIARMRSQRSTFTLHKDLDLRIDSAYADSVWKVEIPKAALDGAKTFLQLSGINEYSVFPDLDGLGRYLWVSELGFDIEPGSLPKRLLSQEAPDAQLPSADQITTPTGDK